MSNPINDGGGPAFPCGPFGDTMRGEDGREYYQFDRMPGMTLRDYFAGRAVSGIFAAQQIIDPTTLPPSGWVAQKAYQVADAMLAERSKR